MGTKEAPPSHEGPPPVTHGGRGPSRRPRGPVRPPPALPSRDSAHELSPDTCVRPGQWLALASRQRSLRGVGVTTAPSGVQCSKLCLPGHVGRSASWDSRGERVQTEKQEEGPCGMSSSVQVCFQTGAGRGHRSGTRLRPGVRSAWSVPTSVLSDEARNPSALHGKGTSSSTDALRALAPALSGATRHPGVRVSDRTCSPERRGAGAKWVDLGTPCWLKCDSVGIDLRPCVRPRKGQRDGGLRLPGPRTDVRGGGGASV